jgi:hypothetical protein
MRTSRLPVAGTALLAAVLGLSALTACEFPEKDKKDGPSASAPASSAPSDGPSATASGEPSEQPSRQPTTRPSSTPTTRPTNNTARRVVDARTAGGLPRYTGADAVSDMAIDPGDMRDGMNLVVAEYGRTRGKLVLVVAVDGVPEDTNVRREHLFRGAVERLQYDGVPEAQPFPAGPLGGSVECMSLSLDATGGNVVCGWADKGTAGVAIFEDSSLEAAATQFVKMRADIEK